MSDVKVIFFTIKETNAKLRALVQTVTSHFLRKEKINILVPDTASLNFVDLLLWNQPKESFLPHSTETSLLFQDLIHLALPSLDAHSIVFNLCQEAYTPTPALKILYELEDLTHPQKAAAFQIKFKQYQKAGFTLCAGE